MQAELKRSMTLTLNQLDKPYYLSYTWTTSIPGRQRDPGRPDQFEREQLPRAASAYARRRLQVR